jgi:hypothetical protein
LKNNFQWHSDGEFAIYHHGEMINPFHFEANAHLENHLKCGRLPFGERYLVFERWRLFPVRGMRDDLDAMRAAFGPRPQTHYSHDLARVWGRPVGDEEGYLVNESNNAYCFILFDQRPFAEDCNKRIRVSWGIRKSHCEPVFRYRVN